MFLGFFSVYFVYLAGDGHSGHEGIFRHHSGTSLNCSRQTSMNYENQRLVRG